MAKKKEEVIEVEHSKHFEQVKTYYTNFLEDKKPQWNKARVYAAVGKWITEEEYEEITGEPYEAVE